MSMKISGRYGVEVQDQIIQNGLSLFRSFTNKGNTFVSDWYVYDWLDIQGDDNDTLIRIYTSDTTIVTGAGNDTISVVDGDVYRDNGSVISSGSGNDNIILSSLTGPAISTVVNGGTGDDYIQKSEIYFTRFDYAEGDGNDIIDYSNNDTINITSGKLDNSVVSGNDVILKIGSGSITLKRGKDKKINIVQSDITNPTVPGGTPTPLPTPTIPISSYNSDKTVLTLYETYEGTTLSPANYESTVKEIHANFAKNPMNITGNEKDNIIFGSGKNDTISGAGGNDTVYGNEGNDIISGDTGSDKLSGDAGDDAIMGGVGNDALYGGIGNDVLDGGADSDTLVGGDGNNVLTGGTGADVFLFGSESKDIIKDYSPEQGDKLQFDGELITGSMVSGNDVILVTENGTVTLEGAKGKEISYINALGKTRKFTNTYQKTTDDLAYKYRKEANSTLNATVSKTSTIKNKLLTEVVADISGKVATDSTSLKNYIKTSPSNVKLPDEVYAKVSELLGDCLTASVIDEYKTDPNGWTKQIYQQITGGLKSLTQKVTGSDGVNYTLVSTVFANSNNGVAFITVTGGGKTATLSWSNVGTQEGKEGLANYLKSLGTLNKEVWKDFMTQWLGLTGLKDAGKYLNYAEKIVTGLCDEKAANEFLKEIGTDFADKLKEDLGSWFWDTGKTMLRQFVTKYIPGGAKIVAAADALNDLKDKSSALEEKATAFLAELQNYQDADSTEKLEQLYDFFTADSNGVLKTEYEKAYKVMEDTLSGKVNPSEDKGILSSLLSSAGQFFGGIFDVVDRVMNSVLKSSASSMEDETAYISQSGAIVEKAQNTVAKLGITGNVLTYSALNSGDQNLVLGSSEDTRDLFVKTKGGKDSVTTASSKHSVIATASGADVLSATGTGDADLYGGAGGDIISATGSGSAMVIGGKGDDTIYGGTGGNTYQYAEGDGHDVVYDFNEEKDKIWTVVGKVDNIFRKEEDIVLSVGSGSITLKDATGKKITMLDDENNVTTYDDSTYVDEGVFTEGKSVALYDSYKGSVFDLANYANAPKNIDATPRNNKLTLKGDGMDNEIWAGRGGGDLCGMGGDDILHGGYGADNFWFSEGKDTVFGYESGMDSLCLAESIKFVSVLGSDVLLSTDSGSITVKDAKDKTLSIVGKNGQGDYVFATGSYNDLSAAKVR